MRAASGCSFTLPLPSVMKTKPLSPMRKLASMLTMLSRDLASPARPRPSSCWKLTNSFTSPLLSRKMLSIRSWPLLV
ncbi:hypothetical protein D3C75_787370 [compost metagenome]